MEIKASFIHRALRLFAGLCFALLLSLSVQAQKGHHYFIKNGKMYIQLIRGAGEASLDSFIIQNELQELYLKEFLKNTQADSLYGKGWKIEDNNESVVIISKPFEPSLDFKKTKNRILFPGKDEGIYPLNYTGTVFGYNQFRNKEAVVQKDSFVTFFFERRIRGNQYLAGWKFYCLAKKCLANEKNC